MTITKKSFMPYVHTAIMLLFIFGFPCLSPIGAITPLGMKTLGTFIAVIYGWSTLGMIWPSLLGLASLSILTGNGAIATFKAGFGDRVTVAIFLLMIFGELINKVGLSKYIADWCVSRKFVKGKPYAILAMFCLAGGIISAFVNCFAGIILIWGIFYNFCKEVGLEIGDKFAAVSLIAINYICCMAGDIFPFLGLSILATGLQESILGMPMPYVQFSLAQLIMVLLASVIYFAFAKFIVRPDVTLVKAYEPKSEMQAMTGQQKFVFVLLVGLMVALFLPGLLPSELVITQMMKALDISGMIAIVLSIYYVANLNNKNAVNFAELAKDMNWSIVLMFATVAPLAAAVQNTDSGILGYVTTILNGFLSDMNPYVFVIVIIFLGSIITQFCNNVAIVMMITPIMYSFAIQLGANPYILTTLIAFNLNIAYCTPAASGTAAMIFANEWVNTKTAYAHGVTIFVINMAVTVIGMFLCMVLF